MTYCFPNIFALISMCSAVLILHLSCIQHGANLFGKHFIQLLCQWKNNRRNSGGMLQQKVYSVAMWHLTFDVWHLAFDIWRLTSDVWHLTFDVWHLILDIRHSTFNIQHWTPVTSIALTLFKRLRVTLVTSIASMDWVNMWKSCRCARILDHCHYKSSCRS